MSSVIHQHFIIHKPYGYLSQFVHNMSKRKNKKLLGELGDWDVSRSEETLNSVSRSLGDSNPTSASTKTSPSTTAETAATDLFI